MKVLSVQSTAKRQEVFTMPSVSEALSIGSNLPEGSQLEEDKADSVEMREAQDE